MEHETIVRDGWTDGWMMDAKAESEKKTDTKTDTNSPSKQRIEVKKKYCSS